MVINLNEKSGKIQEYWHPYIVGELNENYVKLARLKGDFIWHKHDEEDEMFFIVKGALLMEFQDKTVTVNQGEVLIIPKGVEHKPSTINNDEVIVMLIEPKSTLHTGDVVTEQTVTKLEWI